MSDTLHINLLSLPESPGVYRFYDKNGKILYVGKAKNIKKRVSSYFTKNKDSWKTSTLVKKIRQIEYIVTSTEADALLLENTLIKELQPKYNIQLKDDKTYPWICIKKERFPRVFTTRRVINDGSKYFGPYPSVKVVNTLLNLIRDIYPLRTCSLILSEENIKKKKFKVCLEYHLGNCKGPCEGFELEKTYKQYIENIQYILKGNLGEIIRLLKEEMGKLSDELKFEEAQRIKEKIETIKRYQSRSVVVSPNVREVDVITILQEEKKAFVNFLMIRKGSIVHGMTVEVAKKLNESDADIINFVLLEMRNQFESQAKEVLLEESLDVEMEGIRFFVPQRGEKKTLVDLSKRNVIAFRQEKIKRELLNKKKKKNNVIESLQKDLKLKVKPIHIECFDNSNLQGTNAVAACVVFKKGKPSKKDYRHFNIKTVVGPDDFASMEEVVYRRYSRLLKEEEDLPQLIVIDGGRGQLGAALKALERLKIEDKVAVIGIAKRLEEIFFPGDDIPLYLDKRSDSLKMIQHIRNEAHRFGIEHHRGKRSKNAINSVLDEIKGIGLSTKEKLFKKFKTIENIKKAEIKELEKFVGKSKAQLIHQFFIEN